MAEKKPLTLAGVVVAVVAVLAMILVAMSIVIPPWGKATEDAARLAMCGSNLNMIGKGIHIYLAEHEKFPLRVEFGDVDAPLGPDTQADDVWDEALTANATQNFWLLIAEGTAEKSFRCPADGDYRERRPAPGGVLERFGWVDKRNFSYGLHKPYQQTENSQANKAPLTSEPQQGDFVIMADKNVNGRIYWAGPSDYNKPANHPDGGFNCLTYQGSVKFHKTDVEAPAANSRAGIDNDDLYEAGDENGTNYGKSSHTGDANPTDETDTFIVPW